MRVLPFSLIYQPEIKHKNSVFSGSMTFDVKKSKKSNMDLLKIKQPFSMPNDKVAGIAIIEIKINSSVQAFILDILNLSVIVAHGPSRTLIPEVIAAQSNNIKNSNATMLPPDI